MYDSSFGLIFLHHFNRKIHVNTFHLVGCGVYHGVTSIHEFSNLFGTTVRVLIKPISGFLLFCLPIFRENPLPAPISISISIQSQSVTKPPPLHIHQQSTDFGKLCNAFS